MILRVLILTIVVAWTSSMASAAHQITIEDHPDFGVAAITRDSAQGLDFLDLRFTTNRSFDEMLGQFGLGGDFEGFRYATVSEVVILANNFGFVPEAVEGQISVAQIGFQLTGLVNHVDSTLDEPSRSLSRGMTGNLLDDGDVRRVDLQDIFDVEDGDIVDSQIENFNGPDVKSSRLGSWLVHDSPAVVPEPASVVVWCVIGALMGIGLLRRRK